MSTTASKTMSKSSGVLNPPMSPMLPVSPKTVRSKTAATTTTEPSTSSSSRDEFLASPAENSRKRNAASSSPGVHTDATPTGRPGGVVQQTTMTTAPPSLPVHICLCQPDPKIPRPRNAFILYRQHHQATVAANHPELTNPEISKVIGERWGEEPLAVRNQWKVLAEEEKIRHQQRYPEYKYQPKKGPKGGIPGIASAVSGSPPVSDYPNCPRCGGRTILTPAAPTTLLTPDLARLRILPPLTPSSAGVRMDTPRFAAPQYGRPRGFGSQPHVAPLQMGSVREVDEEVLTPLSPESKKRRLMSSSGYHPGPGTPYPVGYRRNSSISRPDVLMGGTHVMGPPPRPRREPSITLPPLQTSRNNSSVEAMVMSLPPLSKIRILQKICPALNLTRPNSAVPKPQVRGAIIAIECVNKQHTAQVESWLAEYLVKDNEYTIKTFREESTPYGKEQVSTDFFISYLRSMSYWHKRAEDIVKYVTSTPGSPGSTASPKSVNRGLDGKERSGRKTPNKVEGKDKRLPVALIDQYMLTLSDSAASQIPINDSYTPFDHWQWTATLWRGIVGADLTICIQQNVEPEEIKKLGSVEVRMEFRAIMIRLQPGEAMDEKSRRRLEFEVGEVVRSVSSSDPGSLLARP